MLIKNFKFVLASILLALCASCAKEGPTGPIGPAGPSFTNGYITGFVDLYDIYGSQILIDSYYAKVELSLSGATSLTPTIAIATDTTYPAISGQYTFSYLSTGNYSITAFDTGFGYTIANNFQFVSGTLHLDIKMSAIPQFYATSFVANTVSANDSLVISLAADPRPRNCIVFVNSAVPADDTLTPPNYILAYKVPVAGGATKATLMVPAQDLYNANFVSGQMVYYTEYSYVVNDASVYENPNTGQKMYYAINNPIIDSAKAP